MHCSYHLNLKLSLIHLFYIEQALTRFRARIVGSWFLPYFRSNVYKVYLCKWLTAKVLFQHVIFPVFGCKMARDVKWFWRHLHWCLHPSCESQSLAWVLSAFLLFLFSTDKVFTKSCFLSCSRCDLLLSFSMCVFRRRERWMMVWPTKSYTVQRSALIVESHG